MDRYPALFVRISLVYFAIGVTLGALMGANMLNPWTWRFVHIHLSLLGFMTMMISGVAYHVLPRFSGKPVRRPALIGVHFWLANVGLAGMVGTRALSAAGIAQEGLRIFPVFGVMAAVSIWLLVYNLYPVVAGSVDRVAGGRVEPGMKVSEVLARWPATLDVFKKWGFTALANPAARATFARLVSVEKACRIHRVDPVGFLTALNAVGDGGEIPLPLHQPGKAPRAPGRRVGPETVVGELLRVHPAARPVLERRFGVQTFSCPGIASETLEQSAQMHGVDPTELLEEVNAAIRAEESDADAMGR